MNTIFFGSFFINNFGNFASKNEISRSVYLTLCYLTGYSLCMVVIPLRSIHNMLWQEKT